MTALTTWRTSQRPIPGRAHVTTDVLIAGDDAPAKARVAAFIESLGLRPLDTGGLEMAHWLEGTGLVMMGLARYGAGNCDFTFAVSLG
jgi:8-hydroxy-5-deazaflavin:NADPH oxidoreductase